MKRLFGTDGIRGVAGEYPLDPSTVRQFGVALGEALRESGKGDAGVLLGRDTRESGTWIRDAVAAGLRTHDITVRDAGVISTPGLAWGIRRGSYDAGVMISASHNPFLDNGLKVFGGSGFKLSDKLEAEIERKILDHGCDDPGEDVVPVENDPGTTGPYTEWLQALLAGGRFAGLKLVLDCANGSAAAIAPQVFRHYGAEVHTLGTEPDGKNINLDCGSLHLDTLGETVKSRGADLGLAFDGDADRCLAVDARGRTIDGDMILYLIARSLKRRDQLPGNAVVATIMSNYWLEDTLGKEGMTLERTAVGDKYVLERMLENQVALGGEQSGHVIAREHATTGDGILTAVMLVDTLLDEPETTVEILDRIQPYPQLLKNVRVREKPDLRMHPVIGPVVQEVESALEGQGRVVLRYSGTEPVARVMVEGRDSGLVSRQVDVLVTLIERELGA
ncbi:MAG: phosphoglucosamine mutase [Acidobacteriota bacterium]|nr:phosphoglucosamine mutase [Acidobacteriota bacterium]MDH3784826.1 phosphoglucosamine mutase [Acidobacteriota bacterium]